MTVWKGTPGEWSVIGGKTTGCVVVTLAAVAKTRRNIAHVGGADREANAKAISAVPQLIDALAGLIPQNLSLENLQWPDEMTVPIDVSLGELRRAREALKAAGVEL